MLIRRMSSSPMRRRLAPAVGGLWAGALLLQLGCYSYLPVQSAPPTQSGREVGLVINDRGRSLLGDRVGALVEQIDGRIDKREGGTITMTVFRVTDMRGNSATWTGEQVTIPEEAILGYRPKALSKFKTVLFIGAVTMAILTTLSRTLDLFGVPTEGPTTGSPQQS